MLGSNGPMVRHKPRCITYFSSHVARPCLRLPSSVLGLALYGSGTCIRDICNDVKSKGLKGKFQQWALCCRLGTSAKSKSMKSAEVDYGSAMPLPGAMIAYLAHTCTQKKLVESVVMLAL